MVFIVFSFAQRNNILEEHSSFSFSISIRISPSGDWLTQIGSNNDAYDYFRSMSSLLFPTHKCYFVATFSPAQAIDATT